MSRVRRLTRRGFIAGSAATMAGALLASPHSPPASALGTPGGSSATNRVDALDAVVASRWFVLALALTQQTPGFTPPVASRAFGYAGVALYESLVAGMPDHRSLAGALNVLEPLPPGRPSRRLDWNVVVDTTLATVFHELYARAPDSAHAAIETQRASTSTNPGLRRRSEDHGEAIAAAVLAWSHDDGGHDGDLHNFPADYVAPTGPGLWTPTPPAYASALQPYWGENRCLGLGSADDVMAAAPDPFSIEPGSAFWNGAHEVYETVNSIDAEQLAIARFWADDPGATATPPGHTISILDQIVARDGHALDTAAEAYCRLGIALSDAFVGCWRAKYTFNLIRPITYIREHIDPAWGDPLPLATPPFPEHTSGHSVQAAAGAEVLATLFGDVPFVDATHESRGLPSRSFGSIRAAADEAAISRLYGGIHYRRSIEIGTEQGRAVGAVVNRLAFR